MSTSSGSSEPCGAPLAVVEVGPEVERNRGLGDGSAVCDLVSLKRSADERLLPTRGEFKRTHRAQRDGR